MWLEMLGYGAEVCGFKSRLGNFFKSGKDKTDKGEGWALHLHAMPKMYWASDPHYPTGH